METVRYGEVGSVDFAVYLVQKANELKMQINVTKLQKWLYICYGLYLAASGKQLLTERPKAWDYGPVFPKVHKMQIKHGRFLSGLKNKTPHEDFIKYEEMVEAVLRHFGDWTAGELVAWTHKEGSAWDRTMKRGEKYMAIENYDITLDFKEFVSHG